MPAPRKYTSDPNRWPACVRCGSCYPASQQWPEGTVCFYCVRAARNRLGTCAECGHTGILPGLDPQGRHVCVRCCEVPIEVQCKRCCEENLANDSNVCWRCLLSDRINKLLVGPGGAIPEGLQPLAQAIVGMPRPNSGWAWIHMNQRVPDLLRGLASGDILLSHEAFDSLPRSRTVEYLRGLLVTHGCLPWRDEHLVAYDRWLASKLDAIADAEQRKLVERYTRWHVIRRLRDSSHQGPMTANSFLRAKQHTTLAIQFLQWLADRGRQLNECTQHDVDAWFGGGTSTRGHANNFLYWAIKRRLVRKIAVPWQPHGNGPLASEKDYIEALRALLLHETLPTAHRAIGIMLVLFGQPVSKIVTMRMDEFREGQEGLQVKLGKDWTDVPEPAAAVIRFHLASRPGLSTAANPHSPLAFPGRMPGRTMHVYSVAAILRESGIPAMATRSRAWMQMVRHAPPSVLADALGINPKTAMRYAERAGTDYLAYATLRWPVGSDDS
ncbi:hypothetical protein ACFCZ1_26685 [Streptomyces sp. NPDC056224]|uniref:hypothetical protein n=1 Tax=Streptomyces sp. NPDC056224 TaxID=3345750 RepID=UPI0035D954FD